MSTDPADVSRAINVKNKSHSITAAIEVLEDGVDGVLIAQGGALTFTVTSDSPLPAGSREVRAEFADDGGGLGKGGTMSLTTNGTKIGEGHVEQTLPFQFSFDETIDVGCDTASPVAPEYGTTGNEFTGKISWVRIDLGDDGHPEDPDAKLQAALIKQ